jgi:cytochrome P450
MIVIPTDHCALSSSRAEEFLPERFADGERVQAGAFTPFSIGRRDCIGRNFAMTEMVTAMASLLHFFRLDVPQEYDMQVDVQGVTMVPLRPLAVTVTPRRPFPQ